MIFIIAFLQVKACIIDPDNDFGLENTLSSDDVNQLVKLCISKLLDKSAPSLETIKMQVYFDLNYTTRGKFEWQ